MSQSRFRRADSPLRPARFTAQELADIRRHLDSIEILGGRYPEDQEKMTGL